MVMGRRDDPLRALEGAIDIRTGDEGGNFTKDMFFAEPRSSLVERVKLVLGPEWVQHPFRNGNWRFQRGEGEYIFLNNPVEEDEPPASSQSQLSYVRESTFVEMLISELKPSGE